MKRGKGTLCMCGFVLLFVTASQAQKITNARSEALGGADLNLKDVWSLIANPAAAAQINSIQAAASYKRSYLLKELDRQSAAFVLPVAKLAVAGIAFTQQGYSLYKEQEACFSWSKNFAGKISAGISFGWESIHLGENYGSKYFYHVLAGVQTKLSNEILFAAVIDKPLNSTVNPQEKKSSLIKTALTYIFSEKLSLHVAGAQQSSHKALFSVGLEYQPHKNFFLRVGLSTDPLTPAFGFGWQIKKLRIDVAASQQPVLGYSPVLSLLYFTDKEH